MRKSFVLLLVSVLVLVLAACSPGGTAEDPYADPGTAPPPAIEDPTIATSGSISPREGSDLVDVNIAGFLAPSETAGFTTSQTTPALDEGDITVVEDGVVQGITVERIGGETRAPADIVFVFDTTGSMGGALTTVQNSIIDFVDFLDASGLDVQVGAVTYGDAFDTLADPTDRTGEGSATPPGFDPAERPTYPLTDDFDAFKTFIDEDSARGGGDGAENGVGALGFAYDNMDWRAGAQRILIVITDIYSHNDETFGFTGGEEWMPENPDELLARLRGNATVHVISPDLGESGAEPFTDMAMFAGVDGTGGQWVEFSELVSAGASLTELEVTEATAGGYVVTFRGDRDGTEHTVRVVINDDGTIRGEFTLEATY